jgi:UDP-N-acetylmuramoyl-tripeptide--D-alanyl-D-alanine ligase
VVDGPEISGICIDTRSLQTGDLFIALSGDPGPRFHSSGSSGRDGHEFLAQAQKAGAAGLMVSANPATNAAAPEPGHERLPMLRVPDTLDGLWQLGAFARQRMSGVVTAVTGSSGKTTFRHWLEYLLGQQARVHASTGSLNNHWGVPLSLARMPPDSEFGVFEIGTNNPGEIEPLSRLVAPHLAVVLNVLPAHLGRFDDIDQLRFEKLSIARGLPAGGTLVVPEDLRLDDVPTDFEGNIVTFGSGPDAGVQGLAEYYSGHTELLIRHGTGEVQLQLNTTGAHRVQTCLAVFACLQVLGADLLKAASDASRLGVPEGRGNIQKVGDVIIIDDSYNANPVSMVHAIRDLARAPGQTVAILGEMFELGDAGPDAHRNILEQCAELDGVITVGSGWPDQTPEPTQNGRPTNIWAHCHSADQIPLDLLPGRLGKGATILVKGSNQVFWVNGFIDRLCQCLATGAADPS